MTVASQLHTAGEDPFACPVDLRQAVTGEKVREDVQLRALV